MKCYPLIRQEFCLECCARRSHPPRGDLPQKTKRSSMAKCPVLKASKREGRYETGEWADRGRGERQLRLELRWGYRGDRAAGAASTLQIRSPFHQNSSPISPFLTTARPIREWRSKCLHFQLSMWKRGCNASKYSANNIEEQKINTAKIDRQKFSFLTDMHFNG